jgi:hypothetical protein
LRQALAIGCDNCDLAHPLGRTTHAAHPSVERLPSLPRLCL